MPEIVNIEEQKANIGIVKANIEDAFSSKTASHICTLLDKFGFQTIFGRSDVQNVLGLKSTRSSALLREMTEKELIEQVTGFGKGKYRFKKDAGKYDENLHVITIDSPEM